MALNFPTANLVVGVTQYTSDLGTTYIWDGVKWVGRSAGGAVGTNSIQNSGFTVQVDAGGNLVLPEYSLPNTVGTEYQVLAWPASGTVLEWTDQSLGTTLPANASGYLLNDGAGNLSWAAGDGTGLSIVDFGEGFSLTASNKIVTNKLYSTNETQPNQHYRLELDTNGVVVLPDQSIINGSTLRGVYGTGELNYTGITIGPDENRREESWVWVDANGAHIGTSYSTDAYTWNFDNNGTLTAPNDIIVGSIGEGGRFIQDCDNGTTSMRWINVTINGEGNTELIRAYSGDPDDDNETGRERAQVSVNWLDDYQSGLTIRAFDRTNVNSTVEHDWQFQGDGNLKLPLGGNILNNDGSIYGGGGNANTGDFTFDADTITNGDGLILETDRGSLAIGTNMEGPGVAGHFHIAFDGSNIEPPANDLFLGDDYNYVKLPGSALNPVTPYGVEIGTYNNDGGDSYSWRFDTDGNLQLPQGSKIFDQVTSVEVAVGRASSDNPYWYNIFGDTGATNNANVTINGSVVRDTGGNVYAIGSVVRASSFDADNLFLKYSPLGELLWRRTWTDDNNLNCGSYNASVRYLAANVDLGTQDTIVWAAYVPWDNISYVGTMDTEGEMVDQFGAARLATRLDNVKVTDLEWGGNIGGVGDSVVSVVGHYYDSGPGLFIPFVGGVDLDTADFIGNITVTPAGSDQSAGAPFSISYTNTFKAAATPAAGSSAIVGTYYDGTYSHAMLATQSVGPLITIGIGVDSHSTDNVTGDDLCCDENGNVYVIVNNISSDYAVLIKSNLADLATGNAFWQTQLGFELPVGDTFYATTVAYDNGYVYVLGQYYDDNVGDTDAMIIKVAMFSGDVVWQRRIGSPGDDGVSFFGPQGSESSSGITVQDDLIAVSFATEARTPGVTPGSEYNTVTLQYPVDGSITGTFGDFVISDFDIGNTGTNYSITTLTTTLGDVNITSGFATLDPTVQTVGTGWTNTQWDLENNIQIVDPQTFKFNADGTFDTAEIRHQTEVKITANTTVANAVPSTWTFQNNDGLRFPDGTTQYGAYVETEMALDGGSAGTVFNIVSRPLAADGGGSSSRFGVNDPVYDGSSGDNYVLDGGGA
jgi:hypothetical protein